MAGAVLAPQIEIFQCCQAVLPAGENFWPKFSNRVRVRDSNVLRTIKLMMPDLIGILIQNGTEI